MEKGYGAEAAFIAVCWAISNKARFILILLGWALGELDRKRFSLLNVYLLVYSIYVYLFCIY